MTNSDMISAKTRAIKFFGIDHYIYIRDIAERYVRDNNITMPSDGIESMPTYWHTIHELITEGLV